jgi:hypothetical protein
MNRGDRREAIFLNDVDHRRFLETLAEGCIKADWQVPPQIVWSPVQWQIQGSDCGRRWQWLAEQLKTGQARFVSRSRFAVWPYVFSNLTLQFLSSFDAGLEKTVFALSLAAAAQGACRG